MINIQKVRIKEYPNSDDCVIEYQIYPEATTWSVYAHMKSKHEAELLVAKIYLGLNPMFKLGD